MFPYKVIAKSLNIKVEKVDASVEADRIHILNSIIGISGNDLNQPPPPEEYETFTALNESLKSVFCGNTSSTSRGRKIWRSGVDGDVGSNIEWDRDLSHDI